MRGYTYHLAPTTKPGIVKLRPTTSTYAKAFAPSVVLFGGFALYGTYLQWSAKKAEEKLNNDLKKNKK